MLDFVFDLGDRLAYRSNDAKLFSRVDGRLSFVTIVQVGEYPIVLIMSNWIEFVSVTLSALDGQAKHRFA